ncbi:hypothetical protein E3O25_07935 [Cryobacterium sp. TMT1-3]|uniref:hypothetical protein n=1 Tax=Cryobacterium sp. TMT1-3 TaxID=1259237 RepID=UPI00106B2198|nr:hypothetical protein [Cryobacterium sp. TMT1-3]TFC28474.1 hypothetical protein E3O25_07935 [Cryobacterium sp. TMT1-3]
MTARRQLPPHLLTGPFAVSQGAAHGLSPGRLRASDLARPFWGVRAPASACVTTRDLCRAFAQRMPVSAFFSHHTAALLFGAPLPPNITTNILHVSVPLPGRALRVNGVAGHALAVGDNELIVWLGFSITSPARTWCDLAESLTLRQLVAVGDYFINWRSPLATYAELARAVDGNRRGKLVLRHALSLLNGRAESSPESELRVIVVTNGLPHPLVNENIFAASGRFLCRADLLFKQYGELLEYEGDQHRTDQRQWRRDLTRTADVESEGLHVTRVNADDLRQESQLVARIARNLRRRGWLGDPRRVQ